MVLVVFLFFVLLSSSQAILFLPVVNYRIKMKNEVYLNYAKTCRKRTGLSQSEVAELIGLKSPHSIYQTEQGNEIPILSRALSYQIIFDKQVHEIFFELSKKSELDTLNRISKLLKELRSKKQNSEIKRKIKFLEGVSKRIANNNKE